MKKAFTLAELLIVVLVLGVLATVSVPKMKKVLETRKTTEAENMLTALRTEQEKRCALGKTYIVSTDGTLPVNQLPVLAQATQSKNYTYQLTAAGAEAVSNSDKTYTIKMRSYKDGDLCCDGADCSSLNKDYPSCPSTAINDECAAEFTCSGTPQTRSCGCLDAGRQEQTCNTATGEYEWGSCTGAPEICPCVDNPSSMPVVTEACGTNGCGTRTKLYTCDAKSDWVEDGWSECDTSACPASACSGTPQTRSCGCKALGTQTQECNENTGQWVWGECNEAENCTCNAPWHTDLSEQYYGGKEFENQVCCEDGKIKTYGSATFGAPDMYCCNPKICCYIEYDNGRMHCYDYPNKTSCLTSMGEKFAKQGCFLDESGEDIPPGSEEGEEEEEEEICSGTHTIAGDAGNYALASCKAESQYTCADISSINTYNCKCTVNVTYSGYKNPNSGDSVSNACWVGGTYTLSK